MKFHNPLVHGYFIERYNRFLVNIRLDDGTVVQAHCPNSGSLKSCLIPEAEVYLSYFGETERKTKYTWEMINISDHWVGINTNHANVLALEILQQKLIPTLSEFEFFQTEQNFHDSRLDILAIGQNQQCFIEVKNVTLREGDFGMFPDAVTQRGQKHLETLIQAKKNGYKAVMLFIVQRTDVNQFKPANKIDPIYTQKLFKAAENGVEIYSYQILITPTELKPLKQIPVILSC